MAQTYNEFMLEYIINARGSIHININDAKAALASDNSAHNFSSLDNLASGVVPNLTPEEGYAGRTYENWDLFFENMTRPTVPTSYDVVLDVDSAADLSTHLSTAGNAPSQAAGLTTLVRLTSNITQTSNMTIFPDVHPGATVALDGNGYTWDAAGYTSSIYFSSADGVSDSGYEAAVEISAVGYSNTGTGFVGDDAIITIAGTMPNWSVGDVVKLWTPITTTTVGFDDPNDGALAWSRNPHGQRIGMAREIKAIDVTNKRVTLHGHLYEGNMGYWNAVAESGTYSLYASRMTAQNNNLWIHDFRHLNTNQNRNMNFAHLRGVNIVDCEFDQSDITGGWDAFVHTDGCYEVTAWDSVFHNDDEVDIIAQYGLISLWGSCRTVAKYTGEVGSPAQQKGYTFAYHRHGTETSSASYTGSTGQSNEYYAERMGSSVEFGENGVVYGQMNSNPMSTHSSSNGFRRKGVSFTGYPLAGDAATALLSIRGCSEIIEDMTLRASEAPDHTGITDGDWLIWRAHGGNNQSAAPWGLDFYNTSFPQDKAGIETWKPENQAMCPPSFYDCHWPSDFAPENGEFVKFYAGQGVGSDSNAYIDDVLPGSFDDRYKRSMLQGGDYTPSTDITATWGEISARVEVICLGFECKMAAQSGGTLTMFDVAGTLIGRAYVTDKTTETITEATGAGDYSNFEVLYEAPPTAAPGTPTLTATKNAGSPTDTVDLVVTHGAGARTDAVLIEYSSDNNVYSHKVWLGPGQTTYQHGSLSSGGTHYWRAWAYNKIGKSALAAANATTD